MTPNKVKRYLKAIRLAAPDPEHAHDLEDKMRGAILEAISRGRCDDPEECARIALTSDEIDFPRWCA